MFPSLAPLTQPEWLQGHDRLAFAGIDAPRIAALPVPQQFAEKLHAYSLPYSEQFENSRVKDLADMVLYLETRSPDPVAVAQSVRMIFEIRNTHAIPALLPPPPQSWNAEYADIAARCDLRAADLKVAYQMLPAYWASLGLP
jgi:hypothetical protein